MKKAGEVLPFTLTHLGIRKKYEERSVTLHWREIVGEEIYAHSRAASINRGVLLVEVDNSVWCHHLAVSKNEIINKVNTFAGDKLITDIRFKAGDLKNYQNYENDKEESSLGQKLRFMKLSPSEKEEVEQKTAEIKNYALKQKITKILKKDIALRKVRIAEQWKSCKTCSTLCPPEENYCPACSLAMKKEHIGTLRKILMEVPWLNYIGIRELIDCSREEYLSCKQDLQEYLAAQVRLNPEINLQLITYIMLKQGLEPDQITDDIIEFSLHSLRRKKYVSTPGG